MLFKDIINATGHTPLVEISRTNPNRKVNIFAKLEGQNAGGSASIKDRIARYMIEQAEQQGTLTKEKTIIEATSGNTGIALAWLGHLKGYRVTIVMPENMSNERKRLIRVHGADLVLTKGSYGVQGAIEKAHNMVAKDNQYLMLDQFSNPANPLAHYETTAVEILEDFPHDQIDVLIVGVGTGGTLVGLTRRLRETYPKMKTIGIEPPPNDAIQGLRCLGDYVPPILDLKLIDERAVVTSQEAYQGTSQLVAQEGIFAGLSSGAVIHHAKKVASEMNRGNIVTILADGGWKYLSMNFWKNISPP